jgi:hypothetical protein
MTESRYTEEQVLNLARRAYKEGNANFDVVPEKCALLVIDGSNQTSSADKKTDRTL